MIKKLKYLNWSFFNWNIAEKVWLKNIQNLIIPVFDWFSLVNISYVLHECDTAKFRRIWWTLSDLTNFSLKIKRPLSLRPKLLHQSLIIMWHFRREQFSFITYINILVWSKYFLLKYVSPLDMAIYHWFDFWHKTGEQIRYL